MSHKYFISGSSLLESVIAISIITICSLMAIMTYSIVIDRTPPLKKYNYKYELEAHINEAMFNNNFEPFMKKYKGFTIEKRVEFNEENKNLAEIKFYVNLNNENIIYSFKNFKSEK